MSVPRSSDEETGPDVPPTVRVGLKQIWDASLTYDLLSQPASDTGPVFVGRETLLGPLVNAIGQPDRRGTYLVSGYRGVGKTSLIIQATRLAYPRLQAKGWRLLPLVLNVSQISASMEAASDGGSRTLQIDARKLLTALLRKLLNWVLNSRDASSNPLVTRIEQAYQKANATRYTETQQQRVETLSTAVRESRRTFQVSDILKLVAAVSLFAAATVEGIALLGSFVNQLHILAIGLAGTAVLSFQRSFALTRSRTQGATTSSELVFDNSLHQLETELQDILEQLYQQKYRTLIILEELDKIEDQEGHQLDSVIRYFKNLFTQAPALFFFLTDKAYYDLVSQKIEIARRQRSYAIEHTFFTHRLFVSRPSIEECLQYLMTVFSGDHSSEVEAVIKSQSDRIRVRRLEKMSPLEQVLRVLLFRSYDHFFDLKNEMRQFVHVAGTESWLEVDKGSMPKSERALAGFHFLVEQKMLSYRFSGGRDYADEALRSCLFAVFESLGSAEQQETARFYPSLGSDGDQLALSEYRRIKEAVDSLVDDLERGGAITRLASDVTEDQHTQVVERFVWRDDAAARFEPVARLEPHELALLNDLSRMAKVAELFSPNGRLQEFADDPGEGKDLFDQLSHEVQDLEQSAIAIPIEETMSRRRQAARKIAPFLERAFGMHQERLVKIYGLTLTPISKASPPDAFTLSTGDSQTDRPVFLLYESIGQDGQELHLAERPQELERFAVVNVTLPGSSAVSHQTLRDPPFPTLPTDLLGSRLHSTRVPLDEELEARQSEHPWGERTADELRFAQLWCQYDISSDGRPEPSRVSASPCVLLASDGSSKQVPSLHEALSAWLKSTDVLLAWDSTVGPPRKAIEQDFMFGQDNESRAVVVELSPDNANPIRFISGREIDQQENASIIRLIAKRRVVLGWFNERPSKIQETLVSEPWSHAHMLVDLNKLNELPAALNHVSVLHPLNTDWSNPSRLSELVQQRYPGYAISVLQSAAEAGNSGAMARLVILFTERNNRMESSKWRAELVQSNDLQGIMEAAFAVTDRDPDGAVELYQAAAEAGNTGAMARLISFLTDRDDRGEASKWRAKLVRSGDVLTVYEVARRIEDRDPDGAVELYQAAADAGWSPAWRPLLMLLTDRNPEEAGRWRARLVQLHDTGTIVETARAIEDHDPKGASELYQAAIKQHQEAAENGNVEAMEQLVVLLTDRNPEEAGRWRARLVQSNDLRAITDAARAIEDRDLEGAVELYRAAAQAGRVGAMERLVALLAERNPEESGKWRTQLEKRREGSQRRTTAK